jgi:hypothetical protein
MRIPIKRILYVVSLAALHLLAVKKKKLHKRIKFIGSYLVVLWFMYFKLVDDVASDVKTGDIMRSILG